MRASAVSEACVLTVGGVLDDTTYIPLREAIVKAALDEPRAVVVDVTKLVVRDDAAWTVFTSARWQVAEWPDVPIGLVCGHDQGQSALRRNGITRYVPVYSTLRSAISELLAGESRRYRRRAKALLPATKSSAWRCRTLTAQWLTAWSRTDFIHAVSIVTTELAEMTLTGTHGPFSLRLETDGSTVAVAIQHIDAVDIRGRESLDDNVSRDDLIAGNCRLWGTYMCAAGHTVWAVVGPENRF
ncbi:MAG: sulfate transporter [Mycobacterium sp.]|nr:sulfate transporter [Mycobacterium sp.]MBV9721083.1 sulfate transporter [Mycobacterium sp.]